MSPNVGNFVHDLVEMAKAMETLPQVQAENDRLKAELDKALQTVQDRELSLIGCRDEINLLNVKVRATEAERDDAELRFLELDEKSDKAVKFILTVMSEANKAVTTLNPPKPQPEPEPVQPPVSEAVQSIEPQPQGQSEVPPTLELSHTTLGTVASPNSPDQTSASSTATQSENASTSTTTSEVPQPPANQGSSDANPTSASAFGGQTEASANVTASSTDNATSGFEPKPSGPYTGKSYRQHPIYVSPRDWIAGGGTEETYYS